MDTVDPLRFIFASLFVLGLLGLFAVCLKRYGQKPFASRLFSMPHNSGRVAILETQYIDHKTKIILVKRDNIEHLLLISDGKTTIIEAGIGSGIQSTIEAGNKNEE